MRAIGENGWRRIEVILGLIDAVLGLLATGVLTVVIIASNPSAAGVLVVLIALAAHVQIALFAHRHSVHVRAVHWWALVASVVMQIGVALLGILSFGVLYAPAILLSVALLIVGFKRQFWDANLFVSKQD